MPSHLPCTGPRARTDDGARRISRSAKAGSRNLIGVGRRRYLLLRLVEVLVPVVQHDAVDDREGIAPLAPLDEAGRKNQTAGDDAGFGEWLSPALDLGDFTRRPDFETPVAPMSELLQLMKATEAKCHAEDQSLARRGVPRAGSP